MKKRNLAFFFAGGMIISACLTIGFPGNSNPVAAFLGFNGIFIMAILFCSEVLKRMEKILLLHKMVISKITKDSEIKEN
ncbi:MAG TPA: hypothetical protein PK720_02160 [bacterium]|nr:hypothetical protein [bacterium]